MTAELFEAGSLRVEPPPAKTGSPDQRRTVRQRAAILGGAHPLSAVARHHIGLHRDADRQAEPGKSATGPTCGGCVFRVITGHHSRSYAKCLFGLPEGKPLGYAPRASHSSASDCRAWWPACTDFQALPESGDDR